MTAPDPTGDALKACENCGRPSKLGDGLCPHDTRTLTTEAGVSLDEVEDELVYLFEEVGADDNIPALALARRVIAILTRIKESK